MTQKPSIEIISHSFPSEYTPYAGTFVRDHIRAISGDFQVSLSIPTPYTFPLTSRHSRNNSPILAPDNVPATRIKYLSFPKKRFPRIIKAALSKKLTTTNRDRLPDLFHFHFLYPSGLAITKVKETFKRPVVLTIHGVDFYHSVKDPKLRNLITKELLAADAIVAVGPKLKAHILDEVPEISSKLDMICNYVDTSLFKPPVDDEKNILKQKLRLSSTSFQLLCVANIRYKKGIDVLIKATEKLPSDIKMEVHCIGRLDDEPDYLEQIKGLENQSEINIHLHGPKARSEILTWMKAADGFVLPSRNEPFGIALIEAMACGLPVISTKSGGPEIILSEKHGALIESDNISEMAKAIEKMIGSARPDTAILHQYIQTHFGIQRYSSEYSDLYKQLIH